MLFFIDIFPTTSLFIHLTKSKNILCWASCQISFFTIPSVLIYFLPKYSSFLVPFLKLLQHLRNNIHKPTLYVSQIIVAMTFGYSLSSILHIIKKYLAISMAAYDTIACRPKSINHSFFHYYFSLFNFSLFA